MTASRFLRMSRVCLARSNLPSRLPTLSHSHRISHARENGIFACLQNFWAVCFFCYVLGKVLVKHVVGIENRKLLPQLSCPILEWSNGSKEDFHGKCASGAKWFQFQWSEVIQILSNLFLILLESFLVTASRFSTTDRRS